MDTKPKKWVTPLAAAPFVVGDGDGNRTIGASRSSPAENVAHKPVCPHSGGIVMVRKRCAIDVHRGPPRIIRVRHFGHRCER
jgi:hypothetical protein